MGILLIMVLYGTLSDKCSTPLLCLILLSIQPIQYRPIDLLSSSLTSSCHCIWCGLSATGTGVGVLFAYGVKHACKESLLAPSTRESRVEFNAPIR